MDEEKPKTKIQEIYEKATTENFEYYKKIGIEYLMY